MNIIFLGGFPYPTGMAGTKRIQHAIDSMRQHPEIAIHVIVLRQSSSQNILTGTHHGIPYETVKGDFFRGKALLMLPWLNHKAKNIVQRLYQPNQANIIYVYGPLNFDNIATIRYSRKLGFKIVFDLVEDNDLAFDISNSLWHRINNLHVRNLAKKMPEWSDGIVVISSHLLKKYSTLFSKKTPLHYRPISVDFSRFSNNSGRFGKTITLFYAGSFGQKDGVPVLLDAFDQLAVKHKNIRLVLTGKGSNEAMQISLDRIKNSPYSDRIDYKGYLDDEDYYAALNVADIPCMTRIDTGYANAGFPFKLGEFLATGKPVIASNVSDVGQLFEDRHDIMLVKPDDSKSIVASVEYLLSAPEEALSIGRRGKKTANLLFDHVSQGESLLNFLQKL